MRPLGMNALLVQLSAWYLPAIYIATVLASTRLAMPQARAEWTRSGFILIVVQLVFLALNSPRAAGCVTILTAIWSAWFLVRSARLRKRLERAWLLLDAGKQSAGLPAIQPILLCPPFTGSWRAVAGGSDPAKNHHFGAPPQWFAYDFVRADGISFASEIISPCDGTVVGVESALPDKKPKRLLQKPDARNPAGNYVVIRLEDPADTYVVLAHFQQGSVRVRFGDRVHTGQFLGRCGNSGNTTAPHLHMHAHYVPPSKLSAKGAAEPMQWKARPVPIRLQTRDIQEAHQQYSESDAIGIVLGKPLRGQSAANGDAESD